MLNLLTEFRFKHTQNPHSLKLKTKNPFISVYIFLPHLPNMAVHKKNKKTRWLTARGRSKTLAFVDSAIILCTVITLSDILHLI